VAVSRTRRRLGSATLLSIVGATVTLVVLMTAMPGRSYEGALAPPTAWERHLAGELRRHVEVLAGDIGERNERHPAELARAADYVAAELGGSTTVARLPYRHERARLENVEGTIRGTEPHAPIVVVGAHYDSVEGSPGANDNGTGVAALLALARHFASLHPRRTLRFVAFANEEPPYFQRPNMGSLVYARSCRAHGDDIGAMLSLETMGFYDDRAGSQHYPLPGIDLAYPDRGDFLAIVGNLGSRSLVRRVTGDFRASARFPSEGAAFPSAVPGVGWSDHWSFWQAGYPAVMLTDTAPFRYPHYHEATDTPDRVDYARLARVTRALAHVVESLANDGP